jgi:hypothetical protein
MVLTMRAQLHDDPAMIEEMDAEEERQAAAVPGNLARGASNLAAARVRVHDAKDDLRETIIGARDNGWTVQAIADALKRAQPEAGWSRPNVYAFMKEKP